MPTTALVRSVAVDPDTPERIYAAGMGEIPEMGWVVVDSTGLIRLQRVDLTFGDHADDMLKALRSAQ